MRPLLPLALLPFVAGCASLGAFHGPDVLPRGKVRFGAEVALARSAPDSLPEAFQGAGALRLDAGLGRSVDLSVTGGPAGGSVTVKRALPGARAAAFVGASRSAYELCLYGCTREAATTAYFGASIGARGVGRNAKGQRVFWPYGGARVVYADALQRDEPSCEGDCPTTTVRVRRVIPAVSAGVSLTETWGPRVEASVYLLRRPILMVGGALRF